MKFKTQYDDHQRVVSNSGDPMKAVYKMRLNKKGEQVLEKISEYSLYDEIQSHFEETEIHSLIDRYKLTGDPALLNRMHGQFGDFTELPTSLAEVYKFVSDANNFFEQLPVDIRREYNFSATEFLADAGSEKFRSVMSKFNKIDVPAVMDITNPTDTAAAIEMLQNQITDAQAQIAELEGANNAE